MGGRMRKKAGCQWKRRSHRSVPGPLSASGVGRRSNLVPHPVHTALIRSIGPAPKISVQASPPKAAAAVPWGCAGRAGLPSMDGLPACIRCSGTPCWRPGPPRGGQAPIHCQPASQGFQVPVTATESPLALDRFRSSAVRAAPISFPLVTRHCHRSQGERHMPWRLTVLRP